MFHVYCDNQRVTDNPISFNWLQTMFNKAAINWQLVSVLPHGSMVRYKEFKIVRAI